ncbi:MAG: spore cortex biosynthesis protein YabQ [Acutalibacteraceae bacterium]
MTYGLSTSVQLSNFLFAAGFGFLDGILYFIIVLFRKIISRKKKAVIVQDIIFGIVTSVLCFVFMQVYCNGQVRIDLIIASALGFFLLVYTAGDKIHFFSDKLSDLFRKLVQFILLPFTALIKVILRFLLTISRKLKITKNKLKSAKSKRIKKKSIKSEAKKMDKPKKNKRKSNKSRRKINK